MESDGLNIAGLMAIVGPIPGWLTPEEAFMLYTFARDWPGSGRVVELGSYQGRSTICLALGLRARQPKDIPLLAVDTHQGSRENQPGELYFDPATVDPATGKIDTFPAFIRNLAGCGLSGWVEAWRCTTAEGASRFRGPIRLLFVDADHDDTAVRQDIELWFPNLEPGGLLILHDVGDWPGPTRVADELLNHHGLCQVQKSGSALALARQEFVQISSGLS